MKQCCCSASSNIMPAIFIPLWPLCCSVFLKAEQIQLVKKQSSSSSSPPPLFAIFPYKCRLFGNSFDSSERSLSILLRRDHIDLWQLGFVCAIRRIVMFILYICKNLNTTFV
ncbi:hypothetical protein Tsp_11829 [Trichinella spiralis]|uniref:hypothetical protein n=1 Tax=Trichinella spiralis TaxID=6334 RepID=UPI0001EFDF7A|nr:hypothetical protein Tsp_11829 [Trichinella spiralis]